MTEKEMEQQMLDEINKYKPLIAAIGYCDIAKKYAQQEVKKLIIPVVSQLCEQFIPEPKFDVDVRVDETDGTKWIVEVKRE